MRDVEYWAASDASLIGEKLTSKIQAYASDALISGLSERQHRSFRYYFGLNPSGIHATSQVLRGGENGELAQVRVNHSRALVNTLLNLIVAPKLVWQPKAVNIDYDSLRECELAAAILEYYWVERQVSRYTTRALEEAIVFAESFIHLDWQAAGGETYAHDGEAETKTGDIRVTNIPSWDVIRDPNKQSFDACDWFIVRFPENKWDLAAQHPEQAEQILNVPAESRLDATGTMKTSDTDDVACHVLYHKRTPALPMGREVAFLADGTVLRDTELSYETLPLFRVSAGEITGTPYGYTSFLDILGVQELMDSLHTTIASNQDALGGQTIIVEEGTEITPEQMAGGLKVITVPPNAMPPKALELLRTPAEIFTHLANLQKQQELLFGLNSVVRGEPQSGELSGSALALLQSQALQQSSTLQANYLRLVQTVGSSLLEIIKARADVPRQVALVGKSSSFLVTDVEYDRTSLQRVKKVQVDIGNPLSQTPAGRIEMAKELLNTGLIKTAEQYMMVLQTGRLEPLTQSLSHELLLIKSENEQLARGEIPPTIAIDDHMLHAREHRGVLANPEARRNPEVVQAVLNHLAEHEDLLYTTSPATLAMVGVPPPMVPPPGAMGPQAPGGPAGAPPGQVPGGPQPEMPREPTNPATGQEWNATDAGGAVPR